MPRPNRPIARAHASDPLPRYAEQFVRRRTARALVQRFRASLDGREHLPVDGGALLVCHRSRWDLDAVPLAALVWLDTGRELQVLDGRSFPRMPPAWRALAAGFGSAGMTDDPIAALRSGALLCVLPLGDDALVRPHGEVHALRWGARAGFARLAMLAGVPVIPVVALGADEILDRARANPGGAPRAATGSPRWEWPGERVLRPRHAPIVYRVLAPVRSDGEATDSMAVERLRRRVHDAIQGEVHRARAPRRSTLPVEQARARKQRRA